MENGWRLYPVRQRFEDGALDDPLDALRAAFGAAHLEGRVQPGQRVAVAVGSRGICKLPQLVAVVVECLRRLQLAPFIIPAMGSHGRATAEGQTALLRDLGVNEAAVGAPVVSSMAVTSLGRVSTGAEVFFARDALAVDHLVLLNRVKPHTAFRSQVESGLCKMLAVGLGKDRGAANLHKYGLARTVLPAAERILAHAPVLCGIAVVENARDEIHTLRLVGPEAFAATDAELLTTARALLPRIPLDDLDILLVDEMGKNISGTGIDPNVVGFWRRAGGERRPDYRTLIVLDLTRQSHGNAVGIGMVDLTTRRVIDQIDYPATYTNALTTGIWTSARTPIHLETDHAVIEMALSKVPDPQQVRMVRIVNTRCLEVFWASAALLPELRSLGSVDVGDCAQPLRFDAAGRLLPFAPFR
ncbi:MAG: nickel-dependent lactate racemase [Desulfobacterales bacterium]|jgi:hypothetical protein|nr:nickel-dependent lactate racemase [Desulfobacterales bacterium]